MKQKRLSTSSVRLWIGIIVGLLLLAPLGQSLAQDPNLLKNGDFEDGFVTGLGVAEEWGYFQSGNVDAGFYDDTWELVVVEGEHAQLIELINGAALDTYAGIYQSVVVTPEQTYQLSFKGLVRSDAGSFEVSNYGYRLQYAIDLSGNEDWQQVTDWVELPWDEQPRTGPASGAGFTINSAETTFTATGESATIFIRAWKKWADQGEGNYNIDAVRVIPVEDEANEPMAASVTASIDEKSSSEAETSETMVDDTKSEEAAAEPLPDTGGTQSSGAANTIWLTASALIILLLVGSAFLRQRRRISR